MILNSSSKDRKIKRQCKLWGEHWITHQEGQINQRGHLPIHNIVQTQFNLADAGSHGSGLDYGENETG